jgi:hypothetical protein
MTGACFSAGGGPLTRGRFFSGTRSPLAACHHAAKDCEYVSSIARDVILKPLAPAPAALDDLGCVLNSADIQNVRSCGKNAQLQIASYLSIFGAC